MRGDCAPSGKAPGAGGWRGAGLDLKLASVLASPSRRGSRRGLPRPVLPSGVEAYPALRSWGEEGRGAGVHVTPEEEGKSRRNGGLGCTEPTCGSCLTLGLIGRRHVWSILERPEAAYGGGQRSRQGQKGRWEQLLERGWGRGGGILKDCWR